MGASGIDAIDAREVGKGSAASAQLARENERVVRVEVGAFSFASHAAQDREVETMTVVGNDDVTAAELAELRPYFLEVRRIGKIVL
jgi:hypothetical protein